MLTSFLVAVATNGDKKADAAPKTENTTDAEPGQPLAPPPKPGENGGDYFSSKLSLEPNPFEEQFGSGSGAVETPGGTKLPSVAALTSPSSLLPGNGVSTPFNWGGGSLRTGPLSPAMLSGPANDYFGDTSHSLRGGFTPNESSLRTGLTPGGSGSMFPAPSPNSQALFNQLAGGAATPGALEFQRTALNAAAKATRANANQQPVTSRPQDGPTSSVPIKTEPKPVAGAFDPHDNDAANGLFMLAQGAQQRNGAQSSNQQYPVGGNQPVHAHPVPANPANTSPKINGHGSIGATSVRGVSEAASLASEDMDLGKPATRKGKRGSTATAAATNGRRKAEDALTKQPPSKKAKMSIIPPAPPSFDGDEEHTSDEENGDGDGDDDDPSKPKSKMTDEEKRKNFLERNRYVHSQHD